MHSPLHLLHIFATFGVGGPQMRFATLAHRLGGRFTHSVVAADGNCEAAALLPEGVRLVTAPPRQSSVTAPFSYARLLRNLRPDLVQTYNWGAIDAVAGAMLARLCPVIHTEDGFGPDEAAGLLPRRVWTRRLLLRFCRTLVPSQTLLAIARQQYKLPEKRILWIPNGIDTERFQPRRAPELRHQLGIDQDAFVVGTVCRFRAEKRLSFLLRAYAEAGFTSQDRLLLVGDGEETPALKNLAAELGIEQHVVFAGAARVPEPYYGVMDVFAMSSITEQMPMALLEAMSSGLPAVCTAVGDTPHILANHKEIQIHPPHDSSAYAAALRRLATDRQLRQKIGEANRLLCQKRYSLEQMVGEYRSLYLRELGLALE